MWNPPIALSPEEQKIAARTQKARKFFVFLRTIRHAAARRGLSADAGPEL